MTTFDVQSVLQLYSHAYRPNRVVSIGATCGFSGAIITKLFGAMGEFSLRGWPQNSLPRARLAGLHRLAAEVHRHGVTQVPVPIAALDGSTVVEAHGRYWQLEPWMTGEADFWENPNQQRLRAAMICLAQWHQAAANFGPRRQERDWFESRAGCTSPAVAERLELIQQFNSQTCEHIHQELKQQESGVPRELAETILRLYQQAAGRVAAELNSIREFQFHLQPCIRDIWHDHILFTNNQVTGLIDLGACRTENVTTDLARLLGSLVGDDRQAWKTALDVYQQQRPLTLDELRLVKVFDRSTVVLAGMIWLDRLYLQKRRFANPGRVIERLNRIRERLEHLVRSI